MFGKKKKIKTESLLKPLEKKLTEMLHCTGCVPFFMKVGGTAYEDIFKLELDEYSIELESRQSDLFSEGYFMLSIWFPDRENYCVQTYDLSKDHGGNTFWGWDEKRTVCFKEPEIRGCDLYESSVKVAAENIIKSHMNDLIKAIDDIIEDYKNHQSGKEDTFKKKLNAIGVDCELKEVAE